METFFLVAYKKITTMSELKCNGSCLIQCWECLFTNEYGEREHGCGQCEKGYYKDEICKFNCEPVKCPIFHYCKQWAPQCLLDCHEGFCMQCSVMLYSKFSKMKKKEEEKKKRKQDKRAKKLENIVKKM